jgi:hypothetical protein
MDDEPGLTCVRRCQGLDLAQIYKSKLEAWGIPVLLKYESAGPTFGITVDGLGEVRVFVPETYAAEAEALLADVIEDEEVVAGQDLGGAEARSEEDMEAQQPSVTP